MWSLLAEDCLIPNCVLGISVTCVLWVWHENHRDFKRGLFLTYTLFTSADGRYGF